MTLKKQVQAIFKFSRSVAQFISDVRAFIESLTTTPGNTYVTIPPATITTIDGHIDALEQDEATAQSGEDGTAATRDLSWNVVRRDVRGLVRTVQDVVDGAPDETTAVAIVQACGLQTRQTTPRTKPDFAVTNDKNVSGLLHLVSKAAPRTVKASYEWQSSPNGVTFTTIKITIQSRTTWASGATPGTKMYFRKRIITNKDIGTPSWSQTVNIIIT